MSTHTHLTIAVAGHSGHGKTAVAAYLAGIGRKTAEPQKQAARSGRTQILECPLGPGQSVSLMDVPGHPRLRKNAIRGISGADVCILVVAADDGVMPQTIATINIIKYLGIPAGLIVLSKTDLADAETLELAEMEIRDAAVHTVLADAPVIPFSAVTGAGGQELTMCLQKMAQMANGRNPNGEFRMWVDEICGVPGFGTVARGVIAAGTLSQGDTLWVLPLDRETRARTLEVHHRKVTTAVAGQRVGVNLPKISLKEIRRGMALVKHRPEHLSRFLNAVISTDVVMKNHQRIKLYIGTSVANAQAVFMDRQTFGPGESGLVQFRLESPTCARSGDRFLICALNTRAVIGGGAILETVCEKFRAAKSERWIPYLTALRNHDPGKAISCHVRNRSHRLVSLGEIAGDTGIPIKDVRQWADRLIKDGELIACGGETVYAAETFHALTQKIQHTVSAVFKADPLKKTIGREEIRKIAGISADDTVLKCLLDDLCTQHLLTLEKGAYAPSRVAPALNQCQEAIAQRLMDFALDSGLSPFSPGYFCRKAYHDIKKNEVQRVLEFLHDQGRITRISPQYYLHTEMLEEIKRRIRTAIPEKGMIRINDSMNILGYGRSKAVVVFEYLDAIGFTRREGDGRKLADNG